MAATTEISWTDSTWSPVTGCTRVSAGCDHCYSVRLTHRLESMGQQKYTGLTVLNPKGDRHFNGVVKCHDEVLTEPLRWKNPRRIFVNSMSDTFHKDVPFEFIDKIHAIAVLCPQHTLQILTKRTARMAEYHSSFDVEDGESTMSGNDIGHRIGSAGACLLDGTWIWGEGRRHRRRIEEFIADTHDDAAALDADDGSPSDYEPKNISWPLPNVWHGTSAENQEAFDERWPHLKRVKTTVRWLSLEPLLGPIVLPPDALWSCGGVQFVVVGGESGPGARPMNPQWARDIRDQCVAAGIPFHFKQLGEYGTISSNMETGHPVFRQFSSKQHSISKASTWVNGGICVDAAGKVCKIGADFDAAQYPVTIMHRLGKKAAGRLLDGREWNEFPQAIKA